MLSRCKSRFKARGGAELVVLLIIFVIMVIFIVGPRNWGVPGDRDEIQNAGRTVEVQQ